MATTARRLEIAKIISKLCVEAFTTIDDGGTPFTDIYNLEDLQKTISN